MEQQRAHHAAKNRRVQRKCFESKKREEEKNDMRLWCTHQTKAVLGDVV